MLVSPDASMRIKNDNDGRTGPILCLCLSSLTIQFPFISHNKAFLAFLTVEVNMDDLRALTAPLFPPPLHPPPPKIANEATLWMCVRRREAGARVLL